MSTGLKLATYRDLLALPESVRAEVLAGELVMTPAPLPRHSHVQRTAGRFLGGPFQDDEGSGGPGGWWIFEALELKDGVWIETGVYDETHTARIVPFDAIELEVGRFFLPREADEL